jgi:hypothetical protein
MEKREMVEQKFGRGTTDGAPGKMGQQKLLLWRYMAKKGVKGIMWPIVAQNEADVWLTNWVESGNDDVANGIFISHFCSQFYDFHHTFVLEKQ